MLERRIYMDNSATTVLAPVSLAAMQPHLTDVYGNASSLHSFGRDAAAALDEAHRIVGCAIGARASEIVFTGCGTESDNLAIRGAALAMRRQRGLERGHIISAATEHHAVEATVYQMQDLFGFDVTMLPVDSYGAVDPEDLRRAIRPDTVLTSLMLVNNEVGTLLPVRLYADICHEHGVLIHTDAVQAPAYLPVDVHDLRVDMLALSAHKFYGPKGVGVLYMRDGTPYLPTSTGGGHERGRRAGTVNVGGAVGTAAALQYVVREREAQAPRLRALRDRMTAGVLASVSDVRLSGHPTDRLPGHASFLFRGIDGETLLMSLDVEGIAVSTGSACTSGDPEPSPVLTAMGIEREWALGGLRISLGYHNTDADVDALLEILPVCVERVRRATLEMM